MHTLTLVTVVVAALVSVHAGRLPRENKYTTRYDNINLDDILKSDRLLNFYVDCLLDREKRCSPDAKELKAVFGSLVYCENSASDHLATEAGPLVIILLITSLGELVVVWNKP
ncbi:unnamed protein product [Timema podura]|uniref:Uncharacterized protein n=1 Tax=Timema podura TaxID=61482 RepID=A0ABN7NVP6_TIMPD|nr:unnamed protein product [Timema podura]